MVFDPEGVMRVLAEHDVRFVLIGGLAAAVHGYPGITQDLDVCYARDAENLERLTAALRDLRARLRGVDEDVPFALDVRALEAGDSFTFVTDLGDVDCVGTPSGTGGFADLVQGATLHDVGGIPLAVCSLADLERMKRSAGRSKDLAALEWIRAIRDEIERDRGVEA